MNRLTDDLLAPYRDAIRDKICAFCNDRNLHGGCGRPQDDPCSLNVHLDSIVVSILSVGQSRDVADYVKALRVKTCPHCRQDEAGHCALREFSGCATDSYVLEVVDVVEEVARAKGHTAATFRVA
jgi:hypothetical protein